NVTTVELVFNAHFISVNIQRLQLIIKASEWYPVGYDLDVLFTSFKERKLEKDIQRGSKKTLKKIQKEIKENRK
ncbi:endonuclease MutS2, partial [Clostridioides difficile]|nr:endonuclease MutS2 [Clostridioides difficile]